MTECLVKNNKKVLIKGNYAIAQAAIKAGCECYFGYPITPQSEIGEYMSGKMQELQNRIKHNVHTVLGIQCKVSIVEPNTIERFVGKAKRIVDLRNQ